MLATKSWQSERQLLSKELLGSRMKQALAVLWPTSLNWLITETSNTKNRKRIFIWYGHVGKRNGIHLQGPDMTKGCVQGWSRCCPSHRHHSAPVSSPLPGTRLQPFPFPSMRFLGKFQLLGVHCFKILIAKGGVHIFLEYLYSCQDSYRTQGWCQPRHRLTKWLTGWGFRVVLGGRVLLLPSPECWYCVPTHPFYVMQGMNSRASCILVFQNFGLEF